jgi:hypothetical protein
VLVLPAQRVVWIHATMADGNAIRMGTVIVETAGMEVTTLLTWGQEVDLEAKTLFIWDRELDLDLELDLDQEVDLGQALGVDQDLVQVKEVGPEPHAP